MIKKLALLLILAPTVLFSQHTISGTFSPPQDYSFAILYHITPKGAYYAVDTKVSEAGFFELKLDSTRAKGMYKLVYGVPAEQNNFDLVYDGQEDITLSYNAKDGVVFQTSEQNKILFSYLQKADSLQTLITDQYKTQNPSEETITALLKELKTLQNTSEEQTADSFASQYIKANKSYYPANFETAETYFSNLKNTYFKHFNFQDPQLQSSILPIKKIVNYYTLFSTSKDSLSFKRSIDEVEAQLENTKVEYQKELLRSFWMALVTKNYIDGANYLAEQYLIPIAKETGDSQLENDLVLFKNLSISAKAPDFTWTDDAKGSEKTQSLYGLEGAQNYLIVFWSAECSHCLVEVPKLYKKAQLLPEGKLKVIAIGLEYEPYEWRNKIHDFPNFIHVLGLNKWENTIGKDYGVMATPSYFLLDKDKKIIAKPEHVEDVNKALDSLKN